MKIESEILPKLQYFAYWRNSDFTSKFPNFSSFHIWKWDKAEEMERDLNREKERITALSDGAWYWMQLHLS